MRWGPSENKYQICAPVNIKYRLETSGGQFGTSPFQTAGSWAKTPQKMHFAEYFMSNVNSLIAVYIVTYFRHFYGLAQVAKP